MQIIGDGNGCLINAVCMYDWWSVLCSVRLLEGGAESGFRQTKPEEYQSRLFHFCGTGKNIVMTQVITTGAVLSRQNTSSEQRPAQYGRR